jgi:hypothetical protein
MEILDDLFGRRTQTSLGDADQQAIERYRALLRTAPPDAIEQAHQEAFAQLTPEQRNQVLAELSREVPASEPSALALRQPDAGFPHGLHGDDIEREPHEQEPHAQYASDDDYADDDLAGDKLGADDFDV